MADMDTSGWGEGKVVYDPSSGAAITLQRGQDGSLQWSGPTKVSPPKAPANANAPPSVGYGEDMGKTILPAAERAAVGAATSIPTLTGLAAQGAQKGAANYLPEGKLSSAIQSGAQSYQNAVKPYSYPNVQGKIEDAYNQQHLPWPGDPTGKAPLYYPQTVPGEFAEAGVAGGLASVSGPGAMAKALTGPIAKLGGRVATGVGAGLGSEAAGQVADAADLGQGFSEGARIAGGYVGGREAAERPRKMITSAPAISPEHLKMAQLLQNLPGNKDTAGQFTGQPWLLQRDANLAPYAKDPYNNLGVRQPQADTSVLLGQAGISPTNAAQGANRPLIKQAKGDIGTQMDTLGANTQLRFDPEFQAKVKSIQDSYHRINGTSVDPANPSPLDQRISDLYQAPVGDPPHRLSLFGGDVTNKVTGAPVPGYSTIRSDISKQASKFTTTDKVTGGHLAQLRDALDEAMERAQKGTSNEGKWQGLFDQYESAQALDKSMKSKPPAAGVVDPNVVANATRDPDAKIAQIARAQSVVHRPLPQANEPRGMLPTAMGAALAYLTGRDPNEGALAGTVSGPTIQKSLTRNPLTAAIHFSPWNQARLRNQAWQPGPGSTMDPATVARLLTLSGTERTAPQEQ
jgi:hypothetical protein